MRGDIVKNVRIDESGELRCWNCGGKGFTEKRTARSKWLTAVLGILTLGVWLIILALATKKKLKCQSCGEYNDPGNAKVYDGPGGRKYRKRKEQQSAPEATDD